jgi:hypothetical protein
MHDLEIVDSQIDCIEPVYPSFVAARRQADAGLLVRYGNRAIIGPDSHLL